MLLKVGTQVSNALKITLTKFHWHLSTGSQVFEGWHNNNKRLTTRSGLCYRPHREINSMWPKNNLSSFIPKPIANQWLSPKHPPFWRTFESWGIFHWYQKLTLKLKAVDAKIAIFLWTFFLKRAKKRWNALLCEFKAWESWKIDTADLHVILIQEKDDVPVIRRPNEMTKMTEGTGLTSNSSRNGVKCHD